MTLISSRAKNPLPDASDLLAAHDRISEMVDKTPLLRSSTLDAMTEATLLFKCENFQKAGAFKYRGASNAILKLSSKQLSGGVCTHSSGNHAQALALAAKQLQIAAYIVMPENAPEVKVNAVKAYGGQITFCKPTLEARETSLSEIERKTGAVFIHPYNNLDIIEGQASCFKEVLDQTDQILDFVICPVGGGGLLSGTLLSAKYFSPQTRVIGAEPEMANDAWQSFQAKKLIPSLNPQTIADGLQTSLGSITWPIIEQNAYGILTAKEESIILAMYLVWERMKIVIEPSAAVALAVLLDNPDLFKKKKIAIIFSGGNVDLKKLPWM
jgi:threonine dehydratase